MLRQMWMALASYFAVAFGDAEPGSTTSSSTMMLDTGTDCNPYQGTRYITLGGNPWRTEQCSGGCGFEGSDFPPKGERPNDSHMAVAQKTGIPKWVARSVSGNMDFKTRGLPLLFDFEPNPHL